MPELGPGLAQAVPAQAAPARGIAAGQAAGPVSVVPVSGQANPQPIAVDGLPSEFHKVLQEVMTPTEPGTPFGRAVVGRPQGASENRLLAPNPLPGGPGPSGVGDLVGPAQPGQRLLHISDPSELNGLAVCVTAIAEGLPESGQAESQAPPPQAVSVPAPLAALRSRWQVKSGLRSNVRVVDAETEPVVAEAVPATVQEGSTPASSPLAADLNSRGDARPENPFSEPLEELGISLPQEEISFLTASLDPPALPSLAIPPSSQVVIDPELPSLASVPPTRAELSESPTLPTKDLAKGEDLKESLQTAASTWLAGQRWTQPMAGSVAPVSDRPEQTLDSPANSEFVSRNLPQTDLRGPQPLLRIRSGPVAVGQPFSRSNDLDRSQATPLGRALSTMPVGLELPAGTNLGVAASPLQVPDLPDWKRGHGLEPAAQGSSRGDDPETYGVNNRSAAVSPGQVLASNGYARASDLKRPVETILGLAVSQVQVNFSAIPGQGQRPGGVYQDQVAVSRGPSPEHSPELPAVMKLAVAVSPVQPAVTHPDAAAPQKQDPAAQGTSRSDDRQRSGVTDRGAADIPVQGLERPAETNLGSAVSPVQPAAAHPDAAAPQKREPAAQGTSRSDDRQRSGVTDRGAADIPAQVLVSKGSAQADSPQRPVASNPGVTVSPVQVLFSAGSGQGERPAQVNPVQVLASSKLTADAGQKQSSEISWVARPETMPVATTLAAAVVRLKAWLEGQSPVGLLSPRPPNSASVPTETSHGGKNVSPQVDPDPAKPPLVAQESQLAIRPRSDSELGLPLRVAELISGRGSDLTGKPQAEVIKVVPAEVEVQAPGSPVLCPTDLPLAKEVSSAAPQLAAPNPSQVETRGAIPLSPVQEVEAMVSRQIAARQQARILAEHPRQLDFHLDSEKLGEVAARVELQAGGKWSAHLLVRDVQAQQSISREFELLQQRPPVNGSGLTSFSMSLMQPGQGDPGQRFPQQQAKKFANPSSAGRYLPIEESNGTQPPPEPLRGRGGVNLRV